MSSSSFSVEQILKKYAAGDEQAIATYGKLCGAFEVFRQWDATSVIKFVRQFSGVADYLDHSCQRLVAGLVKVDWALLDGATLESHTNLLVEIALKHVVHSESVLNAFVQKFLAAVNQVCSDDGVIDNDDLMALPPGISRQRPRYELALAENDQIRIFETAHRALYVIIESFPMCAKTLLHSFQNNFPHPSVSTIRFHLYVRNILVATEYLHEIRGQLWSLAIDNLVALDTIIGRSAKKELVTKEPERVAYNGLFSMDEDILQEEDHSDSDFVADRREKLDLCMVDVFHFIKRVHNIPIDAADDVHWLPETSIQNDLYETLKQTFDEQLLMAQDVSTVSFIWFYLCGLNETYLNDFLQWLWRWVVSPQMGQSTAKKSHGAACYLAGFLSRGHYISTELSKEWLLKMLQWASDYVKQQADQSRQSAIGLFKHGTFYAVCQAIFLVFCFRYKEFMGKDRHGTNEINQWNLGHIVHSSLCPLRFVAWQVALCFASISRSLQLVYCAHVLDTVSKKANDGSTDAVDTKNAFEGFFPFDPYRLPRSADNVRSLYRHFSPLVSDASSLADEMKWNRARVARQYKTSIGPDEDDFLMDVLSTSVGDKDKENYLTLYAASPGLRQLSDSLQMEM